MNPPAISFVRRLHELLSSMRFAVSLLTVLGIASIIGTVLKQNEPYANYVVQFGQFWFTTFEMLGLYDVYHSGGFLLILAFLVLSVSLCIYRNTPGILRELRAFREHASEHSLRAFSHQADIPVRLGHAGTTQARLRSFLLARGFQYRETVRSDGSTLLAAKSGSAQRLGYILAHTAIVLVCLGGLLDSNISFRVQEWLGMAAVETRDIAASEVPEKSRLPADNRSFRANMTLPEGAQATVAFQRVRDGYLVQELPFTLALKDFRIAHYATGQPKSFESDVEIRDLERKTPFQATIRVNHPLEYKGITIYQSDFQDGGSRLAFNAWPLRSADTVPERFEGQVAGTVRTGEGAQALAIELDDFRLFNVLTLEQGRGAKPRNVGPSVSFKVRNAEGQAREYLNYMQPLQLEGHAYFVSGMRETASQEFRYLRIPADADGQLDDYMRLHAALFTPERHAEIARRAAAILQTGGEPATQPERFEEAVSGVLRTFAQGGYAEVARFIEATVPQAEREKVAQIYLRILGRAAFEALALERETARLSPRAADEATMRFVRDSLNSISDLFAYGTPFYLQLEAFEQRQASGFQLTRSPGKNVVYAGAVLLVLGMLVMIYLRERRIWLLVQPEGNNVLFAMATGRQNRDADLEFARYRDELRSTLEGQG